MLLKLHTSPAVEPVTIDEVKLHLRVDGDDEILLIANLIQAARETVENLCGPLITQTWYQYEDRFPAGAVINIVKPRLQTVTSLKYTDTDESTETFSSDYYDLNIVDEHHPKIVLKDEYSWPSDTLTEVNPIEIIFTCGYGTSAASVPMMLRHAMLLLIGNWYEERQIAVVGKLISTIPWAIEALIANYRYW